MTYDAAGRTQTWSGWTFSYDAHGRLTSACAVAGCASGAMVSYTYDAEGRATEIRSRPASGALTSRTLRYQGSAPAQELVAGSVVREYVTDEAGSIVKVCDPTCASGTVYVVVWNGHGDATGLWTVDANTGALTLANSYTYSTWGTPATTVHNGHPDLGFRYLYVGRHGVTWDELGTGLPLHRMGVRHYAPALCRFLQPDPAGIERNTYAYAAGNPVSRIDPSGTESWRANARELALCRADPIGCFWWARAAATAFAVTKPITSEWKENALRHCIWQCLLTYRIGWRGAERWASAHELARSTIDKRIDLHNNYVGRLFGERLHQVTWAAWPVVWAQVLCDQAWRRGWLWTFQDRMLRWSDGRPIA